MPVYAGIMIMACFASLGLPGLAGFVAEFLVFLGAFGSYPIITGAALIGVVITAGYFLWTIQKIFLGPVNLQWKALPDMDGGEIFAVAPLCALMLAIGVYPMPIIGLINTAMRNLVVQHGFVATNLASVTSLVHHILNLFA